MKFTAILIVTFGLLTGCASTRLYDWGNYEEDLFDYYHQPGEKQKIINDLVTHLSALEAAGIRPAPGLLAEAGTFYLLEGDAETAAAYYRKEAAYWPESQPMMDTLVTNLETR